jgi:hypothetical protein
VFKGIISSIFFLPSISVFFKKTKQKNISFLSSQSVVIIWASDNVSCVF